MRRREAEKGCGLTSADKNCGLAELINGEESKQTGSAFVQVVAAAGATPAELANGSETAQRDQAGRTEILDAFERRCLAALLCGESVRAELRAAHCLTSLFAERVNEKLYERFQDICLASEGEELFLVPDYREELDTLLRETEK